MKIKNSCILNCSPFEVSYSISQYLSLSNGHQLPNILPSFRPPKLLGDFLCGKCKRKNCAVHFLSDPWDRYNIPIEVDEALDEVGINTVAFCARVRHFYES